MIPTEIFSRKCCDIFNNIYFEEYLRATASAGKTNFNSDPT